MNPAVTLGVVAFAPLLHGAMRSLRARLAGRPGPPPIQPYRDLAKLLGKERLLAEGTTPLAAAAPGVVLGVALTFALLVGSPREIDPVSIVLVLALGRFVLVLAALDTRSGFAGMAASREVTFGALAEPALLLALIGASAAAAPALACALAAFGLVALVETARIPVDNQETHYELTMIHEGLLLEYSGPHLAALQLAGQIKQCCFLVLAAAMLPGGDGAFAAWVAVLAVGVTLGETALAKLRLFEVPRLTVTACVLAAASVLLRAWSA